MIKASKRSHSVSYAIRDVLLPANEIEKKGVEILKLNIGDPNAYDFDTPQHIKDALYQAAKDGFNGYTPSEGYKELRQAIIDREKKRNNVDYTLDDVCVTTGVTEALQILLNASLDPNDELLIPGPTYPQYTLITRVNDALPVPYRCIEEEGWQPDVDQIRKKISNRAKGIVVINPNNPTGALYSRKVIKEIIDIAGEYQVPVISDEIYDDLTFDGQQCATASLAKDVPVITFNGFSKVYLMPGWRIGYVLFHHSGELNEVQDAFMRIARSRLCASSVCQKACVQALKGPQDHIKETNKKLRERRDFSYKRLNEIEGISTAKPDGAFYIFPKIEAMEKRLWRDDKEFVLDLLHEAHVLVVNGSGFCATYGKGHFRAVILPPLETLEKAFDKLEVFMKKRLE
ncbi:MAG: aminotransferase class I/II-fold pyridoxal phosphate-dependent enzyme [Candidatus Thermoplasmatota archaeon]|jgi:aspartate/methionine/tyrosine aminotransferase|nr:aminotransferase class I/II-fold pyridoxal phosphate-dependent enzyme [Candidatus Thermoplasmatota archaeon]